MTGTSGYYRQWIVHQARAQAQARFQHGLHVGAATLENPQIKTTREGPCTAIQDHHLGFFLCAIQRLIQGCQHSDVHDVGFAVVHAKRGHIVVQVVTNQGIHVSSKENCAKQLDGLFVD